MRPSTHVYLFLQPFLLLSEGGDGSLVAGNGGQGVLPLLFVAAQLSLQNLHCTTTLSQLGEGGGGGGGEGSELECFIAGREGVKVLTRGTLGCSSSHLSADGFRGALPTSVVLVECGYLQEKKCAPILKFCRTSKLG